MKKTFEKVYQLKLSIKGITPQIWRRIQVPENYTFLDLHKAIQAVMDWEDYHLHEFEMVNPKTGMLDKIGAEGDDFDAFGGPLVSEKKAKLSDYFTLENKEALYTYDFGDNWQVKVRLENPSSKRRCRVSHLYCRKGQPYRKTAEGSGAMKRCWRS